jgi:zinicin-like metallopeptidase
VRLEEFRALVSRLEREIPPEFQGGVVAVDVSPKTLPHPLRPDVYTLGECIPLEWSGSGADLQSRVVLYHGSFRALARLGDFDWRAEAWETLTHELRHHLEWRANQAALEAFDWAAEQNFARQEGEAFDPAFYRSGEKIADGVYKVDDDVFLEKKVARSKLQDEVVVWHGRRYRVPIPPTLRAPAFVTLAGLTDPPPGDAVLVLPRRATIFDLWSRRPLTRVTAAVEPMDG